MFGARCVSFCHCCLSKPDGAGACSVGVWVSRDHLGVLERRKDMASDDAMIPWIFVHFFGEQFHLGDELQPKTSRVDRTHSIAYSSGIARSITFLSGIHTPRRLTAGHQSYCKIGWIYPPPSKSPLGLLHF